MDIPKQIENELKQCNIIHYVNPDDWTEILEIVNRLMLRQKSFHDRKNKQEQYEIKKQIIEIIDLRREEVNHDWKVDKSIAHSAYGTGYALGERAMCDVLKEEISEIFIPPEESKK